MASDPHDVFSDGRQRRRARWPVVVGFALWSAGLALWELTWIGGLAASLAGGAMLTIGFDRLAQGSSGGRSTLWDVSLPIAISLVLISQGVGQSVFGVRVALVGLGTLGMVLMFLRVLDERIGIERQLAQRTLVDERRRLAGEVHDVVGHTLSASMLHTSAARLSVRSDPDAAIASLERAEQQGRRSMHDIRSVVHLLRDEASVDRQTPLGGELPELVEAFSSAGADIVYRSSGRIDDLSAPTALTLYRIVQEGLTNAVRHGTGTIEVSVERLGGSVEVQIANERPGARGAPTTGNGLSGMRERIDAIGGTLKAGSADNCHRWVLHARVPT